MKSVLPPEMESKRITIAKRHNQFVFAMLACLFLCLILLITAAGHQRSFLLAGLMALVLFEGYGIYRIIRHDNDLCRELGYLCPYCHKPLYEARASIHLNGRCPKCGMSVLPGSQ